MIGGVVQRLYSTIWRRDRRGSDTDTAPYSVSRGVRRGFSAAPRSQRLHLRIEPLQPLRPANLHPREVCDRVIDPGDAAGADRHLRLTMCVGLSLADTESRKHGVEDILYANVARYASQRAHRQAQVLAAQFWQIGVCGGVQKRIGLLQGGAMAGSG